MRRVHAGLLLSFVVLAVAMNSLAQGAPATVVVAPVQQKEMAPTMWVPGTVVSRNDAWISAEVAGRLTRVAEVGDVVVNEAPLAQIDRRALQLQREDNQANIKRLQASLAFNAKQLERLAMLRKSDSASKTQFDAATAQREMVAQELVQAQTALARTQYDYDRTTVRAPFNGRVAERLLQGGEFAQVGARLLRLVDVVELEVRANAPIDVAPYLQGNDRVVVKTASTQVEAAMRAIVPIGDSVSRSIELRVSLAPEVALVGAAVRVAVPTEEVRLVNVVPRDAVHLRSNSRHVVVIENGKARVVPVQPGIVSGDWIEVDKVAVGEQVVVRGGERLRDGQSVAVLGES